MHVKVHRVQTEYGVRKEELDEYDLFFNAVDDIDCWSAKSKNRAKRAEYNEKLALCAVNGDHINDIVFDFMSKVANHDFSAAVKENVDCVLLGAEAMLGSIDKRRIKRVDNMHIGYCAHCGRYGIVHDDHVLPVSKVGNDFDKKRNKQWLCPECNLKKGDSLLRKDIASYVASRRRCA